MRRWWRRWWRNETYDREHLRAFRDARPEWAWLPDELVVQTIQFQGFAAGQALKALAAELEVIAAEVEDKMADVGGVIVRWWRR